MVGIDFHENNEKSNSSWGIHSTVRMISNLSESFTTFSFLKMYYCAYSSGCFSSNRKACSKSTK